MHYRDPTQRDAPYPRRTRMRDSERKVGRADHATRDEREADQSNQAYANPGDELRADQSVDEGLANDSADRRGHGAHGKGRDEEKMQDESPILPDRTAGSDRGGSAGWGGEASGGSVIDKRSPDRR
jgi:hypothetical protein